MSKRILVLLPLAWLTASPRASADDTNTYDVAELAKGEIPVTLPAALKTAVGNAGKPLEAAAPAGCKLMVKPDAVAWVDNATTCPALWAQRKLGDVDVSFTVAAKTYKISLRPEASKPEAAALGLKDSVVTSSNALANNAALFVFTGPGKDKPWVMVPYDATKKSFALPPNGGGTATEVVYYFNDGTDYYYGTSIPEPKAAPPPGQPDGTEGKPGAAPAPMDCSQPASGADHTQVVCVDMYGEGDNEKVMFVPDHGHVIRPNTDVVVRVRYPSDADLQIDMGGTRGLFAPSVLNQTGATAAQSGGEKAPPPPPHPVVREQSFAPRKPGDADITITLKQNGNESKHKVELIVEETYAGAVRIGVGFPFGNAVDGKYEAQKLPGSQQQEIVSTTGGKMDFELTVAYAPYLDSGGRSQVRGCYPGCFNPFVAVGVWAPDATGTNFIKSVYAGYEWEPQPSLSIGAGVVLRRVTRLQDGFHVGSAVDGDVPTKTAIGFGGGLIVNFSPEFLRIAKPAASSFLK